MVDKFVDNVENICKTLFMRKKSAPDRMTPPPKRIKLVKKFMAEGWSMGLSIRKAGICQATWNEWAKTNLEIQELRRLNWEMRQQAKFNVANSN